MTDNDPCHVRIAVGIKQPAILPCAARLFEEQTLEATKAGDVDQSCKDPGWDVEIIDFLMQAARCSYTLVPVGFQFLKIEEQVLNQKNCRQLDRLQTVTTMRKVLRGSARSLM